jgi:hypothetical protein
MASRNTFHVNHLQPFLDWCEKWGIPTRPGKGKWQVRQVRVPNIGWQCIFTRSNGGSGDGVEHYTVQDKLMPLVQKFLGEYKEKREFVPCDRLRKRAEMEIPWGRGDAEAAIAFTEKAEFRMGNRWENLKNG